MRMWVSNEQGLRLLVHWVAGTMKYKDQTIKNQVKLLRNETENCYIFEMGAVLTEYDQTWSFSIKLAKPKMSFYFSKGLRTTKTWTH